MKWVSSLAIMKAQKINRWVFIERISLNRYWSVTKVSKTSFKIRYLYQLSCNTAFKSSSQNMTYIDRNLIWALISSTFISSDINRTPKRNWYLLLEHYLLSRKASVLTLCSWQLFIFLYTCSYCPAISYGLSTLQVPSSFSSKSTISLRNICQFSYSSHIILQVRSVCTKLVSEIYLW